MPHGLTKQPVKDHSLFLSRSLAGPRFLLLAINVLVFKVYVRASLLLAGARFVFGNVGGPPKRSSSCSCTAAIVRVHTTQLFEGRVQ